MNKKNKLVYILVIIILVFIWSNSLDSPQESYSKSSAVGEWAMKLLSKFFEHDDPFFIFFIGIYLDFLTLLLLIQDLLFTNLKSPNLFYKILY